MKNIKESIYTVSNDIVARRKSIILPAVFLIAGIAATISSSSLKDNPDKANIASTLLLAGVAVAAIAAIVLLVRIAHKQGIPYYIPTNAKMTEKLSYFDSSKKETLIKLLEERNLDAIDAMAVENPSPLMTVRYTTPDNKVAVVQVQEFVPHMYVPVTEAVLIKR